MTPTQFPILRSIQSTPTRFDAAVEQVVAGVESGAIRNVVLQDVKFTLSRIVDEAWKKLVSEPHFNAGKWQEQPEDVQALHDSISIMGLHDVIAASKKVAKSAATGPAADAMRAYCAEVLPLSQAVASLKDKVVKGRAPNTGPAKQEKPLINPGKTVPNENVTKEGIEVKVGQEWRDLDKRMEGRVCRVVDVADGKAKLQSIHGSIPSTRVSVRRMHKSSTGWALVDDSPEPLASKDKHEQAQPAA